MFPFATLLWLFLQSTTHQNPAPAATTIASPAFEAQEPPLEVDTGNDTGT